MSNYLAKNGALIFLIQILLYQASSQALEYMYPVALFPDASVGFIHQNSHEKIELYKWDYASKIVEPGLYSRFSPAQITLLPDKQGFSFIDNGIIRIKFFHKRSPKSLEITEPIYNINAVFWEKEDDTVYGYFSAQYKDHYAMARIDLDAHLTHTISSKTADFLYPQKSGNNLFFIARSIESAGISYSICTIKFDAKRENGHENITHEEQEGPKIKKTIHTEIGPTELSEFVFIDFGTQPIYFLTMESASRGYVVAYLSHTDSHATFSYYQISQNTESCEGTQNSWSKKKLFDFTLPTSFLLTQGPNQLYEHIVPLLPKKIGNFIYFSHTNPYLTHLEKEYSENQTQNNGLIARESNINIFSYNLDSAEIQQITYACELGEHYFCPLNVGDELYCGGATHDNRLKKSGF